MTAEDPDLLYARRRDALVTAAAVFDVLARHATTPKVGNYVAESDVEKVLRFAEFVLRAER